MRNHITINLVFYDRTHVKNNTLFPQNYDMKLIVRLEIGFIIFTFRFLILAIFNQMAYDMYLFDVKAFNL